MCESYGCFVDHVLTLFSSDFPLEIVSDWLITTPAGCRWPSLTEAGESQEISYYAAGVGRQKPGCRGRGVVVSTGSVSKPNQQLGERVRANYGGDKLDDISPPAVPLLCRVPRVAGHANET
ncbi:hypothetical protein DPEC_G00227770 [Dallia pectoralis]|uniref:Uncharacterized protein n=1 Tax=Dallia pectoralis TaxID=75939 RepID=A0ACC2G1B5_DALPE|nr:hypothetical protein DPEC_G00227770 [Dallia pectoralis]